MKVIEAGHCYDLKVLDNEVTQRQNVMQHLMFVKRCTPAANFPGNGDSHPGTNIQEVLRALIDRCKYLNEQIPDDETQRVIKDLRKALFSLELRAAKRHNRLLKVSNSHCIENLPTCVQCGHIECNQQCAEAKFQEMREGVKNEM